MRPSPGPGTILADLAPRGPPATQTHPMPPQAMGDFWVEVESGKFRVALGSLALANGQLNAKYNQVIMRYSGGKVSQKDQILPVKAFAVFISEAIEKSAFVNMRAGRGDATGMQSFAKPMKGFLTHCVGALSDYSIAPAMIFSDLLRERAKALLNVAKVAAQDEDADSVRLFGACGMSISVLRRVGSSGFVSWYGVLWPWASHFHLTRMRTYYLSFSVFLSLQISLALWKDFWLHVCAPPTCMHACIFGALVVCRVGRGHEASQI